jgi:RNA polymerase sigma-70 factor (ECF subfamily)
MDDPRTDEKLVEAAADGDGGAFTALVRRYEQALAALIRYEVTDIHHAEDVWQETLVRAWAGIGKLRNPGRVRAWLLQIARNRCREFYRSNGRRDIPAEEDVIEVRLNRMGHWVRRENELLRDIREAIDEIPPSARETAKQFYLQGLSIREIAQRRNSPPGTVKGQLYRARRFLQSRFLPEEDDSEHGGGNHES